MLVAEFFEDVTINQPVCCCRPLASKNSNIRQELLLQAGCCMGALIAETLSTCHWVGVIHCPDHLVSDSGPEPTTKTNVRESHTKWERARAGISFVPSQSMLPLIAPPPRTADGVASQREDVKTRACQCHLRVAEGNRPSNTKPTSPGVALGLLVSAAVGARVRS